MSFKDAENKSTNWSTKLSQNSEKILPFNVYIVNLWPELARNLTIVTENSNKLNRHVKIREEGENCDFNKIWQKQKNLKLNFGLLYP